MINDQGQSRRRELNSRPSAYKADALPLSYVGAKQATRAKTSSPLTDIIPHIERLGQAIDRFNEARRSIPVIWGLVKSRSANHARLSRWTHQIENEQRSL
jgi:hypothetical protein